MDLSLKMSDIKPSSTLAITAKAKQMKADGKDIVGFGAGEPDFDTPDHIKEAAIEAINKGLTKYTPATGLVDLKKAICNKLKKDNGVTYDVSNIVVSNGAKHSLTNAFMALLNPEDEVIVPAPFWLSYPQMIKMAGGKPIIITTKKENNYKVTITELKAVLTNKTKAIILNSPSNPTGMVYSKEELEEIANFAIDNNLYVISDEIYEKLIYDNNKHISIASLGEEIYKRTIIINGVSKGYAMTGWRIGYAAAPIEIAKIMGNMQSHATSNPNTIAQMASLAAIAGSQQCVEDMKKHFEERRNYMVERLSSFSNISFIKPEGAFYVFIDISDVVGKKAYGQVIQDAKVLADLLLEHKSVALIPCGDFGFDNHIRLSYAIGIDSIKKGLDRIEEFLTKELN